MSETDIKSSNTNLSELLAPYPNQWVALSEDESKVISAGISPVDVLAKAHKLGVFNPILTHVPKNHTPHII